MRSLSTIWVTAFFAFTAAPGNGLAAECASLLNDKSKFVDVIKCLKEKEEELKTVTQATKKLVPVVLYQCPTSFDLINGGAWASFGCSGQISSSATCENVVWTTKAEHKKI